MSTTLTKPVSRPWRRFLRFSVRGLIVRVLVIGVAIERAGAWVEYDSVGEREIK